VFNALFNGLLILIRFYTNYCYQKHSLNETEVKSGLELVLMNTNLH